MRQETIFISGMSSGDSVNTVRKALATAPGIYVDAVTVGSATVSYDASQTTTAAIAQVVRLAGYVPVVRVPLTLLAPLAANVVAERQENARIITIIQKRRIHVPLVNTQTSL